MKRGRVARSARRAHNPEIDGPNPSLANGFTSAIVINRLAFSVLKNEFRFLLLHIYNKTTTLSEVWGVPVMGDLTYEYIWQIYQKEKQTNELSILPKTFYNDAHIFIKKLEDENEKEDSSSIKSNTQKLINSIFERRKQKIMMYVALNKNIPSITEEEMEFYKKIIDLYNSSKLTHQDAQDVKQQLTATKDIPEILLPSGKKIGPIKKEQAVNIENVKDIDFLLTTSLCTYA